MGENLHTIEMDMLPYFSIKDYCDWNLILQEAQPLKFLTELIWFHNCQCWEQRYLVHNGVMFNAISENVRNFVLISKKHLLNDFCKT